jgi:hypothetical protein
MRLASLHSISVLLSVVFFSFITSDAIAQSGGTIAGNQTICFGGDPAEITSTDDGSGVGTITYQWQSSTNGVDFSNIDGATGLTYNPPTGLTVTTFFKRVLTDDNGSDDSNTLTVTVQSIPASGTIAISGGTAITVCYGVNPPNTTNTLSGSSSTLGVSISYKWEYSVEPFTSWFTIDGATTTTYATPAQFETRQFRRITVATLNGVSCESEPTTAIQISVREQTTAGTIAEDMAVCYSGISSPINSSVDGGGDGIISYEWEVSVYGEGNPWGSYTTIIGAENSNLTFSVAHDNTMRYRRRTVSTEGSLICNSAYTNVVTIALLTPSAGSIIDNNETVCTGGNPVNITNNTHGITENLGTRSYRWERALDPFSDWVTIAGTLLTSGAYDPPAGITESTQYRRITIYTYGNTSCESTPTNPATVIVNKVTAGSIQVAGGGPVYPTGGPYPSNLWICSGGDPAAFEELTPATASGTLSWQWQYSTNNFGNINTIAGATAIDYDYPGPLSNTRYFRRVATSTLPGGSVCSNDGISNVITVTVSPAKQTSGNNVNWSTSATWAPTGAPVQSAGTLGCPVKINHNLVINQHVPLASGTTDFTGVFHFNANALDASGSPFYNLNLVRTGNSDGTQSIIHINSGTTHFEGGADIDKATLYIAPGAKLILGPASCISANICDEPSAQCLADLQTISANRKVRISGQDNFGTLLLGNQSRIIVDGELVVYGNVINNNNGTGTFEINGLVNISGNYLANVGNANVIRDFEGEGDILTCGSMITRGSSTVYGTTNDCLEGPCSGNALANCVQFSIGTTAADPPGSSLVENICDAETTPSSLIITSIDTNNDLYNYEFRWYYSNQSAGNEFVLIDCNDSEDNYACLTDNSLGFIDPLDQTTWHRLQVTRITKSNPSQTCNSYSRAAQVFIGNWLGELDENWDDPINWQFFDGNECVPGSVSGLTPSSARDAIISRGVNFMPKISNAGTREVRDIKLNSGTSLILEGGPNVNLYGLLTVGDNVNFDADGADNNAIFTVKSTSADSVQGRIGPLPATGGLTGNVTVERFSPGIGTSRFNRYISMPVSGVTIESMGDAVQTYFGTKLQYYQESVQGPWSAGWQQLKASSALLVAGRGYTAYNRDNTTFVYRGPLSPGENKGRVSFPVTYTETDCTLYPFTDCLPGGADADGWNLVGNPYPSPIQWNTTAWTRTNIEPIMYIPDLRTNVWVTYDATDLVSKDNLIAMGQAFWVRAHSPNPVLTITENAKNTNGSATFYRTKSDENPKLRVSISDGVSSDKSFLIINPDATPMYDKGLDASKFPGLPMQVALTTEQNHRLFYYNTDSFTDQEIRVSIAVPEVGVYTLEVSVDKDKNYFEDVVLKDYYTQTVHSVKSGPYQFKVTDVAASYQNRFFLSRNTELNTRMPETRFSVYPNPAYDVINIEVSTEQNVPVSMINLNGQTLKEAVIRTEFGIAKGTIDVADLPAGIYLVKSWVDGKLYTEKIVKK